MCGAAKGAVRGEGTVASPGGAEDSGAMSRTSRARLAATPANRAYSASTRRAGGAARLGGGLLGAWLSTCDGGTWLYLAA